MGHLWRSAPKRTADHRVPEPAVAPSGLGGVNLVNLDALMPHSFLYGGGDGMSATDGESGLRSLRIVTAAYRSAREGRAVPVR